MDFLLKEIIEKIKPNREEEALTYSKIEEFMSLLRKSINNLKIDAEVFLGGSFAKGTWLKNDFDVDIFVRFSPKYEDNTLSKMLKEILENMGLKYETLYGSRNYYRVLYKGLSFEIVPIIKITNPNEARNVTDISPLHVNWVKKQIEKNPNLKDEIRLTKYFFKMNNLYGAESYVQGFSGYLLEVLVIYYGGFLNLLRNVVNWKPKVYIDPENYYKGLKEVYRKINRDKLRSPLIVIDPVDPNRNIASAVSTKKFAELILLAESFLNSIDEKAKLELYFKPKRLDKNKAIYLAKQYDTSLIYVKIEGNGGNKDIKNTKARKTFEKLLKFLKTRDFTLIDYEYYFKEEMLEGYIFVFPRKNSRYMKHYGPLSWIKEARERFLKKWKNYKIGVENNGRLYAIIPRKEVYIEDVIQNFIDREDVKKDVFKLEYEILE